MHFIAMILTAVFGVTLGVKPLSIAQQQRLSTVVDGLDSRGDGFEVLIEDVSSWDEISFKVSKCHQSTPCSMTQSNIVAMSLYLMVS